MSALKQRLQREPAFPDGSPERRDHHGSVPDSHPGVRLPSEIRAHRHARRRPATTLSQDGKHQRLNDLMSRALWIFTRQRPYLHHAHGQRRQQTRASASARQRFAVVVPLCDSRFSDIGDRPRRASDTATSPRARHPCSSVVVGTEVNKIHSSGSSPSGACSSQTRMTHTGMGSWPARGSWRGGKSVSCPKASCNCIERAWRPCLAGTSNGRLAWLGKARACVSE